MLVIGKMRHRIPLHVEGREGKIRQGSQITNLADFIKRNGQNTKIFVVLYPIQRLNEIVGDENLLDPLAPSYRRNFGDPSVRTSNALVLDGTLAGIHRSAECAVSLPFHAVLSPIF
jgi:hypothetical protein